MNILITNNYFGTPIAWEYDEGQVERIDLIDFNIHNMIMDDSDITDLFLPLDLFDQIIKYVMETRLSSRNFGIAFQLCTINKRTCDIFYRQIYGNARVATRVKLARLGRTFAMAESFYEEYICSPNNTRSGLNAIAAYRNGSLRYYENYNPWDFRTDVEVQRITIDTEDPMPGTHIFPGQFHGDTIWLIGSESDGIYTVEKLYHPVFVLVLCDYSYTLIPSQDNINDNWSKFADFLRRAFGERTGIYFMVKHRIDAENPFIETTDLFVQI